MILYVATLLPETEFAVLDCLNCEEAPISYEELRREYESLDDFTIVQLDEAIEALHAKGMVLFIFPDRKLFLSKHGRDVIQFAASTERDVT